MMRHHWKARAKRSLVKVRRRVPPGLRLVLGLLLIVGGIFGFLPILGFWMIPLGMAIAALDIKSLRDWLRGGRRKERGGAVEDDARSAGGKNT